MTLKKKLIHASAVVAIATAITSCAIAIWLHSLWSIIVAAVLGAVAIAFLALFVSRHLCHTKKAKPPLHRDIPHYIQSEPYGDSYFKYDISSLTKGNAVQYLTPYINGERQGILYTNCADTAHNSSTSGSGDWQITSDNIMCQKKDDEYKRTDRVVLDLAVGQRRQGPYPGQHSYEHRYALQYHRDVGEKRGYFKVLEIPLRPDAKFAIPPHQYKIHIETPHSSETVTCCRGGQPTQRLHMVEHEGKYHGIFVLNNEIYANTAIPIKLTIGGYSKTFGNPGSVEEPTITSGRSLTTGVA